MEAQETTKAPGSVRRFLNYRKTIWDWLTDKVLDTAASLSLAHSRLSHFQESDEMMDHWQGRVDHHHLQALQAESPEEMRSHVQSAQMARVQVEVHEALAEESVAEAHDAVGRAQDSNREVAGEAETQRLAAADEQRNGQPVAQPVQEKS